MGGRRATVDYQCYIKCAIVYCCILYRRKRIYKNTVTGAVLLTLYLAVLPAVPVDAADYLLAAVYGGAACGAGIGLVLKSGFTTGGTDMLGVLLHRFSASMHWQVLFRCWTWRLLLQVCWYSE